MRDVLIYTLVSLFLLGGAAAAAEKPHEVPVPDVASCPGDAAAPAVVAFYPSEARASGLEGDVAAQCLLGVHGAVRACRTLAEQPAGHGFGDAALAMLGESEDNPSIDYTRYRLEFPVIIPVRFRLRPLSVSPNLIGPAHRIDPPALVRWPAPNRLSTAFPVRSQEQGAQGSVIVDCVAHLDGRLDGCSIRQGWPDANKDFASKALGLTGDFRVTPLKCDGTPVDGAKVAVPINFKWSG